MTAKLTVELMDGTVHEFYRLDHALTDAGQFAKDRHLSCRWVLIDEHGRIVALVTGGNSPSDLKPSPKRSVDIWRGQTGECHE